MNLLHMNSSYGGKVLTLPTSIYCRNVPKIIFTFVLVAKADWAEPGTFLGKEVT